MASESLSAGSGGKDLSLRHRLGAPSPPRQASLLQGPGAVRGGCGVWPGNDCALTWAPCPLDVPPAFWSQLLPFLHQ